MQYKHPGQAFIAHHGLLQHEQDISRYVAFLRQAAELGDEPPIDLSRIYQHFGMPSPVRVPLADQQGILVDSDAGLILIKEDDPIVRQRFTEGHELMELLFDAQDRCTLQKAYPLSWNNAYKEKLCDQGAAELLMPQTSFVPRLHTLGISLRTGRILANLYQTSLLATLIRMIEYGAGASALVMWHCAFRRGEAECSASVSPQKKLRVWWRTCTPSWSCGFIPRNKSVPPTSLITAAYTMGQPQSGAELMDFGWGAIRCQVEAMPMQLGDKSCVLSLLHFLKDDEPWINEDAG